MKKFADPRVADAYLQALRGALHQGSSGATHDLALMAGPWQLSPETITVPVLLWQGELDRNAPPVMARHLATVIPRCDARWLPHDGHLSIVTEHGQAILAALQATETP